MAKAASGFCHSRIFGFLITSSSLRSLSIHRNLSAICVNRRTIEQVMQYSRSKQVVTEFIAKNWKLNAAIAGLGVVREAMRLSYPTRNFLTITSTQFLCLAVGTKRSFRNRFIISAMNWRSCTLTRPLFPSIVSKNF